MKIEDLKVGQIWKPKDKSYYLYVENFTNDGVVFMVAQLDRFNYEYTMSDLSVFKNMKLVDNKKVFFISLFSGMVMK